MIVTRFAPSPTGYLHIGGLITALFSYLWAKKNVKAFKWVGLKHDGEITYQSNRMDIYKKYIKQLLDEGKAYKCYMSKEELTTLRETQMENKERTFLLIIIISWNLRLQRWKLDLVR